MSDMKSFRSLSLSLSLTISLSLSVSFRTHNPDEEMPSQLMIQDKRQKQEPCSLEEKLLLTHKLLVSAGREGANVSRPLLKAATRAWNNSEADYFLPRELSCVSNQLLEFGQKQRNVREMMYCCFCCRKRINHDRRLHFNPWTFFRAERKKTASTVMWKRLLVLVCFDSDQF